MACYICNSTVNITDYTHTVISVPDDPTIHINLSTLSINSDSSDSSDSDSEPDTSIPAVTIDGDVHHFCYTCLKQIAVVCTCNKVFIKEEPSKLLLKCPCNSTLDSKMVDIVHGERFMKLLDKWSDDYYYIPGCRGCSLTPEQIATLPKCAIAASITSCIYSYKGDDKDHAYAYISDSLDDAFIEHCRRNNIYIGEESVIEKTS